MVSKTAAQKYASRFPKLLPKETLHGFNCCPKKCLMVSTDCCPKRRFMVSTAAQKNEYYLGRFAF